MTILVDYIRALRGPILVTGASGFVGANLFRLITSARNDVYAVVQREKNWRLADAQNEQIIAVDLNDSAAVKNLVHSVNPQTIFDCVAYGAYPFENDQSLIYQTNFQAITNLVSMLSAHPIAAYIHAGSSSEYGTNCSAPLESSVCAPDSHYATSKVAVANYLTFMGKRHQFPCVNLRLYSVYGQLEDTSRLMPSLVRHALAGKLPPFVDARTSRDFIHVDDVCAAFVMAASRMHPGLYGENFNIGSGLKTTIADLAATTKAVFNVSEEPRFNTMEGRAWDQAEWYSNPQKAADSFGWQCTIDLTKGLQKTAAWVSQLSDTEFASTTKKNPDERKRSVSAIIACYKDAQAIPIMYSRLTDTFMKLGIDYEIIFVNDCSPDNSAEVIRLISESDKRVIGISHSRNFGSQMAFRSGMELSTKEGVVLLDGDLQDPPELISEMYQKMQEGYEVVYAKRRTRLGESFLKRLTAKIFYRILGKITSISIPVDTGDFRIMDKKIVEVLRLMPEQQKFLRGQISWIGFKQTYIEYDRDIRHGGETGYTYKKMIRFALDGITSFSNLPLKFATFTGFLVAGITFITILYALYSRFITHDVVPGWTSLILAILFIGGIQLICIGIIGEYISRLGANVRNRPLYIISESNIENKAGK